MGGIEGEGELDADLLVRLPPADALAGPAGRPLGCKGRRVGRWEEGRGGGADLREAVEAGGEGAGGAEGGAEDEAVVGQARRRELGQAF